MAALLDGEGYALPGLLFVKANVPDPPGRFKATGWALTPKGAELHKAAPIFVGERADGERLVLIIQLFRFWLEDAPKQYIEGRTQRDLRSLSVSMHGLEHPYTQTNIARLLRAIPELRRRLVNPGGRHPGKDWTREEWHEREPVGRAELREELQHEPTDLEVAARIGRSSATYYRYRTGYGEPLSF